MQLTNILRDVGEDAGMGRIYLPSEDLERFGYSESALERGLVDDRFRALMRFQIERVRTMYEGAEPGIAMLSKDSRYNGAPRAPPVPRHPRSDRAQRLRRLPAPRVRPDPGEARDGGGSRPLASVAGTSGTVAAATNLRSPRSASIGREAAFVLRHSLLERTAIDGYLRSGDRRSLRDRERPGPEAYRPFFDNGDWTQHQLTVYGSWAFFTIAVIAHIFVWMWRPW